MTKRKTLLLNLSEPQAALLRRFATALDPCLVEINGKAERLRVNQLLDRGLLVQDMLAETETVCISRFGRAALECFDIADDAGLLREVR